MGCVDGQGLLLGEMVTRTTRAIVEPLLIAITFLLINIRSLIFWRLFPDASNFLSEAWNEIWIWLPTLGVMVYIVWRERSLKAHIKLWSTQRLLILFVCYSTASTFWSDSGLITLHRISIFVFTLATATFLGARYDLSDFVRILFWVFGITVVLSLLTVLVLPTLGTDLNPPYDGAWRGIFWHKNHLGNLIPLFAIVFLSHWLNSRTYEGKMEKILAILFYSTSIILLVNAKSAGGEIVFLLLHLVFIGGIIWVNIRQQLGLAHYCLFASGLVVVGVVALTNLDIIFGLFNRNTTLTGRIPLWEYIFTVYFLRKPWLGYGFGTIWSDSAVRTSTSNALGWMYPVMIGDNGFIDLVINLGVTGGAIFLALYFRGWIKAIRFSITNPQPAEFFVLLFMVYTLFANMSFSLFMETETMIWLIFLVCIFLMSKNVVHNPVFR